MTVTPRDAFGALHTPCLIFSVLCVLVFFFLNYFFLLA